MDNEFGTNIDPNEDSANFKVPNYSTAKFAVTKAIVDGMTPEQTASDSKLARKFDLPAEFMAKMPADMKAKYKVDSMPWKEIEEESPVLFKKMNDLMFASLVKDDPRETGMLERLWWKTAPNLNSDGYLTTRFRNSTWRGLVQKADNTFLVGNQSQQERIRDKLIDIDTKEQQLASGMSPQEVFVNNKGEYNPSEYENFIQNKEAWKDALIKKRDELAVSSAWVARMKSALPTSEAFQELQGKDGFTNTVGVFLRNPSLIFEWGLESLASQPERWIATALGARFGLQGVMAVNGLSSYGLESSARTQETMQQYGLNPMNAEDIAKWYSPDGEYADAYKTAAKKSKVAGAIIGAFDAISMGAAAANLRNKFLESGLIKSPKKAALAELGIQAPLQGTLGATGEALAQIATEGRITSWPDVVAEFGGEFMTSPIDIATVAMSRKAQTQYVAERLAPLIRQETEALMRFSQVAPLLATDVNSYSDYVREVHEQRGVDKIFVDTRAVHEAGKDSLITGISENMAERFNAALERGEKMSMTTEEFLSQVAPVDKNCDLAAMVAPEGHSSYVEALKLQEQANVDATERFAQIQAGQDEAFIQSSANVGNRIQGMFDEAFGDNGRFSQGGVPKELRKNVTTLLQTFFAQTAKDLGVLPEEVFNKYGVAMFFGSNDVSFDADGKVVPISERAKTAFAQADTLGVFNEKEFGSFFPAIRAIGQWKGANGSTILHETGHMFLNMRSMIARDLKASGQELTAGQKHLVDTLEAVMKWLGTDLESFSKMSNAEQTPLHEKFARTYEKYLWEGHAPNRALTVVFRQLTAWMRNAYRLLKGQIPGAELTPEARVLFDNLLVASHEIEMAQARRARANKIDEFVGSSMASEILEKLDDLRKEERQVAEEMLVGWLNKKAKQIGNMRKREIKSLTKKAQEVYQEIYNKNWEEMKNSPVYKAYMTLKNGIDGRHPKIMESELSGLGLTEEQLTYLRETGLVGDGKEGMGEDIARANGFDSVDAMVKALLEVRDPVDFVSDKTTVMMLEQHPEIASPEAVAITADAAVVNDAYIDSVRTEYEAVLTARGKQPENVEAITRAMEKLVDVFKLSELNEEKRKAVSAEVNDNNHVAYARRHADHEGEAEGLRHALFHSIKKRLIGNTQQQIKSFLFHCKRYKKSKSNMVIDPTYYIAIQDVLTKVGLIEFPAGGSGQRTTLRAFIDKNNESAVDRTEFVNGEQVFVHADRPFIDVSDALVERIDNAQGGLVDPEFNKLTVAEFKELYNLIIEMNAIGHNLESVRVGDEEVALSEAREKMMGKVEDTAKGRGKEMLPIQEARDTLTRIKEWLRQVGASHSRIPMLLAALEDAQSGHGTFFDYIVRQHDACQAKYYDMNAEYTRRLMTEVLAPVLPKLRNTKKKFYEEAQASFDFSEIFVMALNMGNDGNRLRLMKTLVGNKRRPLTEDAVRSMIAKTLTEEDLQSVQKVWDLFAELRPELEEKEIRMRGRSPDWVEPTPVTFVTKDNTQIQLKGGYYPVVYSPMSNNPKVTSEDARNAKQALQAARGHASTYAPHTKERAPDIPDGLYLSLTPRGITEGFANTIHDICWDEWLTQTQRLLNADKNSENSVLNTIKAYYGKEYSKAIKEWIKDIATDGKPNEQSDTLASYLASGTAILGIGFNLVTAAIQLIGVTQSVTVVGGKWVANGVGEVMKRGPMGAYEYAASKSLLMQERARTQFREVTELTKLTKSRKDELFNNITRIAYLPIVAVQMCVDLPTWIGAYNRALAEGMTEESAIATADRMLLDAQGSGRLGDLSGIERGSAWTKLFTVFYTFFNTTLNLVKYQTDTKGWAKGLLNPTTLLLLVFQPVAETFLREALKIRGNDDDDEYWKRMAMECSKNSLNFGMNLFVVMREFQSASEVVSLLFDEAPRFEYRGPTGTRLVTDFTNSLKVLAKKGEWELKDYNKFAISAAGLAKAPWPAVVVNRWASGDKAYTEGKTNNPLVYLTGFTDKK